MSTSEPLLVHLAYNDQLKVIRLATPHVTPKILQPLWLTLLVWSSDVRTSWDTATMSAADDMSSVAMDDGEIGSAAAMFTDIVPSDASSSGSAAAVGAAASETSGSGLLAEIKKLRGTQKALKDEKKQLAKDMKNAMKKKKRLQTKAVQLTDSDLLEVLRMRKTKGSEAAASQAKAKTK